MTWFRVDDQFHVHAKTAALSFAAKGLWLHAGTWCSMTLSDGFVPTKMCKSWHAPQAVIDELIESGLWETRPGDPGYWFHDWLTYQPSRAEVLEKRDADRKRKGHKPPKESPPTPTGFQPDSRRIPSTPGPGPGPDPEEEKETAIHRGRDGDQPLASIGHDFMQTATGRPYALSEWRPQLERIGMKQLTERLAVIRSVQACEFCRSNPMSATPTYLLKHWDRYAAGNPPLKPVVRAAVGGRYAGPSRVATAAEYAADKLEKAPWET
jgi:hypothetical protein